MWLSEKVISGNDEKKIPEVGKITESSGQKGICVQGKREYRNIPSVLPFGIVSVPLLGEKALITPTEFGNVNSGVISSSNNLSPGEVMLYSAGGASIVLKNDGKVLINGREIS